MVRRPTPCPRWGNKLMDLVGPRPRRRGPPTDLLAVRRCDGTALVFAILRGRLDETLSFAGVLALAVILGRFAGRLSFAAVGTDTLHLIGARALLGACSHDTGDQQHRHRTGDQRILRVHFFLLLTSGLVCGFDVRSEKKVLIPIPFGTFQRSVGRNSGNLMTEMTARNCSKVRPKFRNPLR